MEIFGKQNYLWSLNPKILTGVFLICGLFSIIVYSKTALNNQPFDLAQSMLIVNNDFTRNALLETKLQKHIVKRDETLVQISRNYFTSVQDLQSINQISNLSSLQPGRILYIPPLDQSATFLQKYQVKSGDSVESLMSQYSLTLWQFQQLNPSITDPLRVGAIIILPKGSKGRSGNNGMQFSFIKPVRGFITSRFGLRWGRMHYGIDLAAPTGTPVKAVDDGRIYFAGWRGGYGLLIVIDHGQYKTYYGHLSKILVVKGIYIHQGDIIGRVGATGYAFGSHLHFEVEKNGIKLNPYYLLQRIGLK